MIIILTGKSASGKDTIARELWRRMSGVAFYTMYTTRPRRSHEKNGQEYNFITGDEFKILKNEGRVIESRTYETIDGPWTYCTVDDKSITRATEGKAILLMIGTLESFKSVRNRYGGAVVKGILIDTDDGIRLQRALDRERAEAEPKYKEMCRRFLADEEDFSETKIGAAKVDKVVRNDDFEVCVREIEGAIKGWT